MSETSRKTSHIIFRTLLEKIQNGELAYGEVIPSERELQKSYHVGRGVVREALQDLEAMGVIRIKHGERTKVSAPNMDKILNRLACTTKHILGHSKQTLGELQDARVIFESSIAREVAKVATTQDIEELDRILLKQKDAIDDNNRFLELDLEFHTKMISILNNQLLTTITNAVFSWLRDYRIQLVSAHGVEELTIKEHYSILDAIKEKDPDKAEKNIKKHLLRLDKLYLDVVQK